MVSVESRGTSGLCCLQNLGKILVGVPEEARALQCAGKEGEGTSTELCAEQAAFSCLVAGRLNNGKM